MKFTQLKLKAAINHVVETAVQSYAANFENKNDTEKKEIAQQLVQKMIKAIELYGGIYEKEQKVYHDTMALEFKKWSSADQINRDAVKKLETNWDQNDVSTIENNLNALKKAKEDVDDWKKGQIAHVDFRENEVYSKDEGACAEIFKGDRAKIGELAKTQFISIRAPWIDRQKQTQVFEMKLDEYIKRAEACLTTAEKLGGNAKARPTAALQMSQDLESELEEMQKKLNEFVKSSSYVRTKGIADKKIVIKPQDKDEKTKVEVVLKKAQNLKSAIKTLSVRRANLDILAKGIGKHKVLDESVKKVGKQVLDLDGKVREVMTTTEKCEKIISGK